MKRLAASAGFTGLGLMSTTALVFCNSQAPALESRVLLFLFGVALLVLGGWGYAALGAAHDGEPTASRS